MPTKPTVLRYRARRFKMRRTQLSIDRFCLLSLLAERTGVRSLVLSRRGGASLKRLSVSTLLRIADFFCFLFRRFFYPFFEPSFASQYLPLFCDLFSMGVLFLGGCDSDALHLFLVFALFVTRTVSCFRFLLLFD